MPPLSLGCAGNTRVSNELGAGCPWAAHFAAKVNYSLGLCLASLLSAAILAGRCLWIHFITCEREVEDHTKHILVICPLYVALDCMCTVTNGALKGCGRQLLLAPVVLASYFLIGIPSAWLFAWPGRMSAKGLALGSSVGTFAHCVAVSVILWTTNWVLMSRAARVVSTEDNCSSTCRGSATSARAEMPPSLDAEEDEGREPDARRSVRQEVLDQLRLSAPICLGLLANRFMATTSTVIVGHLGEKELAAVGLAVSLANVSGYSILVGIATTLQTTTGQAFGARNFEEVSLSLQRCTLLCLVMLGLIAALWLSSEPLLLAVGQEKAVAALAARYLKYLLPGVCCYLVTQCSQNWLAAQRMTGVQATGGLILAAVYLPLCWTLVHPLKLGFIGAAVATSLSNAILALWMVFKTCRALRSELPRSWQGFSRLAFTRWAPFLKLAVPNFLMISEWWASEIIVLMSGTLPEAEVSLTAMAVFANTCSICFMPPLSWGMAANTRVSNELGAGRPRAAKFASQVNFCFGLCMVLTIALGVLLGRRAWLRLFTSELEVLDYADPVMSICSIYVALDGMCTVASGSLKGCGRQLILAPVVIFAYYAAGIPSGWALAWPGHLSTRGLAIGSTIGTGVHCLLFAVMLWSTNWPRMATLARERVLAKPLIQMDERREEGGTCAGG
ncbi:DTX16 [Symbiodinium microadriaticum]|nr:DTX16 [Symbiodinium microadriaticum]